MENNKQDVVIKKVILDEKSKLHPQEIVIGNAKVLVNLPKEKSLDLMSEQLEDVMATVNSKGEKDELFMDSLPKLVRAQIALASLSLAIEFWIAHLQPSKLKVYGPQDMPKGGK